jgi:hypothetical protein
MQASGRLRRIVWSSIATLLLVGAIWIVATALFARREALRVEAELRQIETLVASGNIPQAQHVASGIPAHAARAHSLTTGPAWWLASHVPYLGRPLEIVRGTTEASHQIGSKGVPTLIEVAASLNPNELRTSGKTLNLAPIVAAAPKLSAASKTLDDAIRSIDKLPSSSWLGAVDGPRVRLALELHSIGGYVDAAARAADVLPSMLGENGPKRYFIGLQNEAEMRGTGGLPGAFAVVVADHGTINFTHFGSDAELLPAATGQLITTGLNFGPEYNRAYGASAPTSFIVNSNLSPNFPYAAQIWAKMWQKVSGQHVDGAIALDPAVLGAFLSITGPVTLADQATIDAASVVTLTERDQYSIFNDNNERKAFVVSILKAVSTKLTSQRSGATALARLMSEAAKQQRLLAWSSDPAVESRLMQTSYAGAIPATKSTFVGPVLNNVAAGKLDFYLLRAVNYHRSGCGDTRDVLVTITLRNQAPPFGLPPYVDTRLDKHAYPVQPGDNKTLLDYYATAGTQLLSTTLNDKPTTAGVESAFGHPIYRMELELPRGTTQTVVLHLLEPATTGSATIWRQPGVTPLGVTYYAQPCG